MSRMVFIPKWKNNSKVTRPTYSTWLDMLQRCNNPANRNYRYYGARGISVCEQWSDYDVFVEDMGLRPFGLTIERIDNDGNYEPENCKWATPAEQSRNTRRSRNLTFQGRTMGLTDWAQELGISYTTIQTRAQANLPVEEILKVGSLVPESMHGTMSRYVGHKCRCEECRKANSVYMRENRHRFKSMSSEYRKEKYRERKQSTL